ncbi:MAG: hypothetical protein LBM02_03180 [Lachnospiraceae bacterium]|jgi:hypothetical protein|nr:hypothetical protein [Lachnospiraceae bacterium]
MEKHKYLFRYICDYSGDNNGRFLISWWDGTEKGLKEVYEAIMKKYYSTPGCWKPKNGMTVIDWKQLPSD